MRKSKDFILAGILAVVLSFVLFGNGIGGNFVLDDNIVIVGNPFISGQLSGFWKIFTNPYFAYQPRPGLYRPLTIASYSLNSFVFGFSPIGFHIVNILFHALASFLIFVLFYRLGGKITAFAGFLFFMFLPIHVEAVTSIVGRAEILSLLFTVGALIFVLKQRYISASVLFFLGLLSKEMAIAFLPIFLFLSRFYFRQSRNYKIEDPRFASRALREANRGNKLALKDSLYFVPSLVVYGVLRYVALGGYFLKNDATFVYNPIKFAQFFSGLWTSFKVFYLYLEKTFFPYSLSADYSYNQIPLIKNIFTSVEAMLGVIIFCLFVLLFFRTKNFLIHLGIIIFIASYFVVSNWVLKTGTIMAERLMFTPSLGLALIAGVAVNYLILKISNKKVLYGFLSLILIFYGFVILDRNKDWISDKNLFESAYAAAPNSVVNQTNKAYLAFVAGDYGGAELRLDKVLNVAPEHVPALNLAGQNYKKLGKYQKSEELWKKAITLRNDYLRAYLSLGILYYENGYNQSAVNVLMDAIKIYPRWNEIFVLSLAKINLNQYDEAISIIKTHFGENPGVKELKLALGIAYLRKGDKNTAISYLNQIKNPQKSIDEILDIIEKNKIYKVE